MKLSNITLTKKKDMSISVKIISVISILVIAIMAAASAIVYYVTYNRMHEMNKQSMQIISSEIHENFNDLIKIQANEVTSASLNKDIIRIIADRNSTSRQLFQNSHTFDADKAIVEKNFLKFADDEKVVEHFFVADKSGLIMMDSNADYLNNDLNQYDFVQQAFKEGSAVSEIYVSSISSRPVVTFVQAVKDDNGNTIGLIGKSMFINYFSNRFDKLKFLNDGYSFIVDGSGNITYHPDKYYIGKKVEINEIKELMKNKNIFSKDTTNYFEYTQNGKIYEAYYTSVPKLKSLIVLTVEQKKIKENSGEIGILMCLIALVMAGIIIIVSNILIKNILKPMKKLIKNTEEISNGNLSIKNDIVYFDEIGTLTESFNRMTYSIKYLITEISDVINDLVSVNTIISSSQNLTVCSMESINDKSVGILKDTEQVNNTIIAAVASFNNILTKIDGIRLQSKDMMDKAQNIMEINNSGIESISELKKVNDEANTTLDNVNNSFSMLGDNLNEISNIVLGVTSISNRTNILSLNASIEAARAGKYGLGFKVVAEEMNDLSMNITEQMHKINEIIHNINLNMNSTKDSIVNINKVSSEQNDVVISTVHKFEEILSGALDIVSSIENIDKNICELTNETEYAGASMNEAKNITGNLKDVIMDVGKVVNDQFNETRQMDKLVAKLEGTTNELNDGIKKFII